MYGVIFLGKGNSKYVTLEATDLGNADVYCSCTVELGERDKLSISLNGDIDDELCVYVVVENRDMYNGIYLGDLDKKDKGKFGFKKEYMFFENTKYSLKDVKVVLICSCDDGKILYNGFIDKWVDYKNKYSIIVDKPKIAKIELVEPEVVEPEVVEPVIVEPEIEVLENDFLNEPIEVEEEVVSEISYEDIFEDIEVENITAVEIEETSEKSFDNLENLQNFENIESASLEYEKDNYKDCENCKYKNEYEYEDIFEDSDIEKDFEVFSELYKKFAEEELEDELVEDVRMVRSYANDENDESIGHRNGEIEDLPFEEVDRLTPEEFANFIGITKVLESSFKNINNEKTKKANEKDFYNYFMGSENKDDGKSFVDMIAYVKKEFDDIKEIMSLTDEEFAQRSKKVDIPEETVVPRTSDVKKNSKFSNLEELVMSSKAVTEFENIDKSIRWVKVKLYQIVGYFDNYWKMFWEPFVVDSYIENEFLLLGLDNESNYYLGILTSYNEENEKEAERLKFDFFEVIGDNNGEITEGAQGYFIKMLKDNEVYSVDSTDKNDELVPVEVTTEEIINAL